MVEVSVAEAKAKLSEIIRRVEAGEDVTITRRGKPVIVMSKLKQPLPSRADFRREHGRLEASLFEGLLTMRSEARY